MPITLDNMPNPQLRYTVKLEWLLPDGSGIIDSEVLYMTDEEFGSEAFERIIEHHKDCINEDWDGEITEWGLTYHHNTFYESNILSDDVISLLNTGDILYSTTPNKERIELALAYFTELVGSYTKKRVRQVIDDFAPDAKPQMKKIVLSYWGGKSRTKNTKTNKWSNRDWELSKLLTNITDDSLNALIKALKTLDKQFRLSNQPSSYNYAVLLAKFLNEYCDTKNTALDFSKAMSILYGYFKLTPTSYGRNVLIPASYYNTKLTDSQHKFHESIRERWADFMRSL